MATSHGAHGRVSRYPLLQAAPLSTAAKQAKQAELAKEKRRLPAAKRRQQESRQDADDFAAEYRMLRKVKKGKMSEVRPTLNTASIELRNRLQEASLDAHTCAVHFSPVLKKGRMSEARPILHTECTESNMMVKATEMRLPVVCQALAAGGRTGCTYFGSSLICVLKTIDVGERSKAHLHNSSCLVCTCTLLAVSQGKYAWPVADLSFACPSLYVLCGGHACQFSYTGWLSCIPKDPVNWCRMLSSKRLWGCTGTLLRRKVALTRQRMQSLQRTGSKTSRRRGAWATKPD